MKTLFRWQRGLTSVEFAIIGALFMIVLFGVLEFGRLLFVWNTLTEATRRGARVAAVCPINHPAPANVAVFNAAGAGSGTPSPVLPGLSPANVAVSYLDQNGNPINTGGGFDPTDPDDFTQVAYVRAEIVNYSHTLLIPLLQRVLNAPTFAATLPRESLGVVPDPGVTTQQCFEIEA